MVGPERCDLGSEHPVSASVPRQSSRGATHVATLFPGLLLSLVGGLLLLLLLARTHGPSPSHLHSGPLPAIERGVVDGSSRTHGNNVGRIWWLLLSVSATPPVEERPAVSWLAATNNSTARFHQTNRIRED
jgi:hypothetical protein